MIYEEKKDNAVYFYNVTYDKEKLKEILVKLENYSYISRNKEQIAGNITRWPATKKNIQKRVISFFYAIHRFPYDKLYPETIVHHTENDRDYVEYEYSSKKLTNLYHYIDIIINCKDIMNYTNLFGQKKLIMYYDLSHKEQLIHKKQLILEGILNYINSEELTNHNPKKITETSEQEYDYKGLNKLYKETLECFNFKLIAIKEYVDNQEIVSGLTLQRKKKLM